MQCWLCKRRHRMFRSVISAVVVATLLTSSPCAAETLVAGPIQSPSAESKVACRVFNAGPASIRFLRPPSLHRFDGSQTTDLSPEVNTCKDLTILPANTVCVVQANTAPGFATACRVEYSVVRTPGKPLATPKVGGVLEIRSSNAPATILAISELR